MAPNTATILQKCPSSFSFTRFSPEPISPLNSPRRISATSNQKSISRVSFSFHSYQFQNSRGGGGFGFSDSPRMKCWPAGFDYFRNQAVSDGGSGGFGGSGDSNSGRRDDEESGGNIPSFLSWYLVALEKHPVFTKSLTSAFLTLIGDLICQILIDQVLVLDVKRTFLFTFLGFVMVGPTLHFWYLNLSTLVTHPGAQGAFLRLVLDQFLFSPIFIGVFLSTLMTLEGRPSKVVPKLQQEWFSSVLANWQLWIPFQFLNFRSVPQQFQVLAANFVALAWNVILSFKAHKAVLSK